MKNMKISTAVILCCTSLTLSACQTFKSEDKINDCSAIFETRDGNNKKITKKKTPKTYGDNAVEEKSAKATECKVLEVKIDKNISCEIVGSDKIDKLSKIIGDNKNDRIVIIAPDKKIRDLTVLINKYLKIDSVNFNKYVESDIFKNFNFPYKGMKCNVSDNRFVVWQGDSQTIMTIQ